jgi:hypothetical protein
MAGAGRLPGSYKTPVELKLRSERHRKTLNGAYYNI